MNYPVKRKYKRYSVIHVDHIHAYINRKHYNIVDMAEGGCSIHDDRGISHLINGDKIKLIDLRIAGVSIRVTGEVVFIERDFNFINIKFKSYSGRSRSILKNFTKYLELGQSVESSGKFSKGLFSLSEISWKLKYSDFEVIYDGEKVSIFKKPLLTSDKKILFYTIAFLSGLPKSDWDIPFLISTILNKEADE